MLNPGIALFNRYFYGKGPDKFASTKILSEVDKLACRPGGPKGVMLLMLVGQLMTPNHVQV